MAGGAEAAQGGRGVGNGSGGVSDQGASLVFRCLTAWALLPPSPPWRWHLSMSWSSTSPARQHRGLTRCRTRRQQHRHPQQLHRPHRRHQRFSCTVLLLLVGLLIPLGGTAGAGALRETFRGPRPPFANERLSLGLTRQSSRGGRRGTASWRHPNGFRGRSILRSTASVGRLSRERSFPTASLGTLVFNRITTSWRTASRFSGREG